MLERLMLYRYYIINLYLYYAYNYIISYSYYDKYLISTRNNDYIYFNNYDKILRHNNIIIVHEKYL